MVKTAPVIIIGEVKSVEFVGPVVSAMDDSANRRDWQLEKITTQVENTLRVRVGGKAAVFYFYMGMGGAVGDWNSLTPGDRCVFFLKTDRGLSRAVRDYWRSSIPIGTGRHRSLPLSDTVALEQRIAVLLLSPGDGMQPRGFRSSLIRATALGLQWIGPCRTAELLRGYRHDSSDLIRDGAREALAGLSVAADPCAYVP